MTRFRCRKTNGQRHGSWPAQELTYAGVTVLHFDGQGPVVKYRDYYNHVERREPPYSGW